MSSSQGCRGLWVCHPPAQVARLRRGLPRRAQGVSLRAELCRAGMTFRRLPKCFGQDLDSATSVSSDTSGKRAVPCSRATCSSRLHFSHLAGAGSYRSRARGRLFRCRCLPPQELSRLDGNQLQTYMLKALKNEDYAAAALIRDELQARGGSEGKGGSDGNWEGIGTPAWLADWLVQIGFPLPLEVQRQSMTRLMSPEGGDALILSQTGSGKTLSYLIPILSLMDFTYFEDFYMNEMLGVDEALSMLETQQQEDGRHWRDGIAAPRQPPVQAVIVVPTFVLGAQVCLTAFRLLGGKVGTRRSKSPGEPDNMYMYKGPKGVVISGIFTDKDVLKATTFAGLEGIQILVGTPAKLAMCAKDSGGLNLDAVRLLVVDEFDACIEEAPDAVDYLLTRPLQGPGSCRRNILCGATISSDQASKAHERGWIREAGADIRLSAASKVPSSTQHRIVLVENEDTKLLALTRLLRQDLKQLGPDAPPARVIVYAQDEDTANRVSHPLRMSLWGDHKMTTLLPSGKEPLLALQAFRENQTTLLLATPHHCRGLDLPAVSHVYNLNAPETATAYIHQAGRTGRVGFDAGGLVTSIVTGAEEKAMRQLAAQLCIELVETQLPALDFKQHVTGSILEDVKDSVILDKGGNADNKIAADVLPEDLIKNLEDVFNLLNVQAPEADEKSIDDQDGKSHP